MTRSFPGKRYELDDDDVLRIVKIIGGMETTFGLILGFLFPKLTKMFPKYIRNKLFSHDHWERLRMENSKLCKVGNIYLVSMYITYL